ncbi:aldehyde dehydrogenase family protein, partial [Chelatococcus sp. GW1]
MDISLLIDGEACGAASGATFERRDPVTGAVATRAPAARKEDAVAAVAAAERAFAAWSQTGPAER